MRAIILKFSVVLLWILPGTSTALAAPANEPPRQLSVRGMENLTAFSRLLGYVRFFHPSDQAAAADWHMVAIAGVQEAEKAVNPADLARTLEDFFSPLAPTLRVYPDGARPGIPEELRPPGGNPEVAYWLHTGVGLPGTIASYSSARSVSAGGPPSDTGLPRPEQPVEVSLGGGVSALLPLTLYRDSRGATLPTVTLPPPRPDKPRGFKPSGKDRATRLAGVALAWPVFQHFYPYFDVVSVDWPAELRAAFAAAARNRNEREFVDTLRRLVAALDDGHGAVVHNVFPRTHQLPITWDIVEGRWVITWADPRLAPGVERGDVILGYNGKPAAQALAAARTLVSAATPQLLRTRSLLVLMVGAKNEPVRLKVQRVRGGIANVTLRRSLPLIEGVGRREPRPEKIAEVQPGIFYVDIDRITDDDFRNALPRLVAARGIVFDLRGYPRYLSTDLLSHLASGDLRIIVIHIPLVTLPDRPWFRLLQRPAVTHPPLTPRITARVAWITNGEAISYAETYMGMVADNGLGEIVGEATAGTNGVINFVDLPGGYSLRFTGMRVLRNDGSRVHGVGIQPTVPVTRTLEGVREGRDEFLARAIEAVQ